jgi:hypothetical protein
MSFLKQFQQFWKKPKIHLYAPCWNEARMLPFFFRHYDPLIERYFIWDHDSTDGSREILLSHGHVTLSQPVMEDNSFIFSQANFFDETWKQNRNEADWIICCDIDEHLYHPKLLLYLRWCQVSGITFITPKGYNMISPDFPDKNERLCETRRLGIPFPPLDKPTLFQPNAIKETSFAPGRHSATPAGRVVEPKRKRIKLLHYKNLGLEYLLKRTGELAQRRLQFSVDTARNFGFHYFRSREVLTEKFASRLKEARDVVTSG